MSWVTDVALEWAKTHSSEIAQWVIDRMQERNTWQGVAAMLAGAMSFHLPSDVVQQFIVVGLSIGGLAAVIKKEGVRAK